MQYSSAAVVVDIEMLLSGGQCCFPPPQKKNKKQKNRLAMTLCMITVCRYDVVQRNGLATLVYRKSLAWEMAQFCHE